jgi:hypothetical protein
LFTPVVIRQQRLPLIAGKREFLQVPRFVVMLEKLSMSHTVSSPGLQSDHTSTHLGHSHWHSQWHTAFSPRSSRYSSASLPFL